MPTSQLVTVIERRDLAPGSFVLVTDGGEQLAGARPGQFVMLRPAWGRDPLLPRAFSILRVSGGRVEYLVKVAGRGTALMSHLQAGDRVTVLGPLGRPFPTEEGAIDVLVAGGVGLAPLLWFAEEARDRGAAERTTLVYGARTARDLVLLDACRDARARVVLATEDGSAPAGHEATRGRVTAALEVLLSDPRVLSLNSKIRVLSCGPNAMMRAVAEVARARSLETLLSLEGEMACGVGVCLGCAVPTVPGSDKAFRYCCTDGPVFDASQIVVP